MEEEEKPQKYSLVTGEKIKHKTVDMIKKQHKEKNKKQKKENKKLSKKVNKVGKKLHIDKESQETNVDATSEQTNQTKVLIIRKQDSDTPVTPKRKFLNFLSYFLVGMVAVFFGYFSGNFYLANLNKVDYSAFDEKVLRADYEKVYNDFLASGMSPARYSASDLFIATCFVMNNLEYYKAIEEGEIKPSIGSAQTIWGSETKDGDLFTLENLSVGMLSVGEKIVYNRAEDKTDVFKATKFVKGATEFEANPSTIYNNLSDYRAEYGTNPSEGYCPYIVNSQKTVIEGSEKVTAVGQNRYELQFSLTTDSAVINYVKQVKHMSGLGGYPTFKQVNVRAVIEFNETDKGKELRFISSRYDEAYTVVYFGVMATCTGYIARTFSY